MAVSEHPDHPLTILLADGEGGSRERYSSVLREAHLQVAEASDGRDALVKALTTSPGIIVLAADLAGINGYDLCHVLRQDTATRTTPILLVATPAGNAAVAERARSAGADAVVIAPCPPRVLLDEVRRVVQRSRELCQRAGDLRREVAVQIERAARLQAQMPASVRRAKSKKFSRHFTSAPRIAPPLLRCPSCAQVLTYSHSHIGGVSEDQQEQWDYYSCPDCGAFQYRQRTRKLRKVSEAS